MEKPLNLNEIIKEKVQASIGNVLTEEQWKDLVDREWKYLMVERVEPAQYSWGNAKTIPAAIKNMIANEMYSQLKEKVKEHVAKYIAETWNVNFQVFDNRGKSISFETEVDYTARETVMSMTAVIAAQVASSINFRMSQEVVSQLQMLYNELKSSGRL
jgi:hypothetical protein